MDMDSIGAFAMFLSSGAFGIGWIWLFVKKVIPANEFQFYIALSII